MRRVALALLVSACHARAAAPPCEAVAGRFFLLATAELDAATVDPTVRRSAAAQLPALRDALDAACRDGAWSSDVRACMAEARDHAAMQACEQKLSDDQRAALDRPAL